MAWRLLSRLLGAGLACNVLAIGLVLWEVDRPGLFLSLAGVVMFGMWIVLDRSGSE